MSAPLPREVNKRLLEALEARHGRFDVRVTLDFETYFDNEYNLDRLTTEGYVRDPRFEVLGVSVRFNGSPAVWMEADDFREWAARVDWKRVAAVAHHAQFDGLILSHHYDVRPGFWVCTQSMARALHGSGHASLEFLGPHYGVGEKGKGLKEVKGKRRKDLTDAQWERLGEYGRQDSDLTDQVAVKMLEAYPPEELWTVDTTIRWFTEPVFEGDMTVLERTLVEDRTKKTALFRRVLKAVGAPPARQVDFWSAPPPAEAYVEEVLGSNDKFAAVLRAFGVEPPVKTSKKTGERAYAFAKDDAGMKSLLEHQDETIRQLAEARLQVKSTIVGSRTERMIACARRGRIPFYLNYCGAHTHRWSGGDKMNPQNFNRGGALRAAILAAVGYLLSVADSSQIEARVLPWLAGMPRVLETFKRNDKKTERYKAAFAERVKVLGHEPDEGETDRIDAELAAIGIEDGDFYSDIGSSFFLKKLSKKGTKAERQLAKNMILGLGFGMGWEKFALELLKGMLGSKPVQFTMVEASKFGVDVRAWLQKDGDWDEAKLKKLRAMPCRLSMKDRAIHCAVADYFVRRYRETFKEVPRLWKTMERIIETMAADGPEGVVRMTFGPLRVVKQGIVKPNGLVLHYPGLHWRVDDRDPTGQRGGWFYYGGDSGRELKKIYGGLLVENCVQSLARDIMTEQALWIRADGYRLGTTTHDEVVAVPRVEEAEECQRAMIRRMRTSPAWCADLPLNADGGVGRSYGAAK